jgi:hypothetical protein
VTRHEAREWFQAKNARRRRSRGTRAYAVGRAARKDLANNGAIGNLPTEPHNLCVTGTTGVPK